MKKLILLIITLVLFLNLSAQTTYFDKLYGFEKLKNNTLANTFVHKAIEYDSNFVFLNLIFKPNITKVTNFLTIDKRNGEIINQKIFGDTTVNYQVVQFNFSKKTLDNNIICSGIYFKIEGSDTIYYPILYKINPRGDTLWTKKLNHQKFATNFEPRDIIVTKDGGFILGSSIYNYNNGTHTASQYDFWIYKTDSLGNKEWEKRIGNSNINDFEVKIAEAQDGYVMTGYKKKVGGEYLYGYVHKIDKIGNTIWQRDFEPNIYENYIVGIHATKEGSQFYLCGGTEQDVACTDAQCSKASLIKIDNDGKIIWDKRYFSSYSSTGIAYNVFYDCEELTNNNIILAGGSSETMYNNDGGMIMEVNSQGDSLWSRIYDKNAWNGLDALFGVTPCKDNGFLFTGTALDTSAVAEGGYPIYKAWLLKTDSLGCSVPGCATGTSIGEIEQKVNLFELLPNPATNYIKLNFKTSITGSLQITDITGKPIVSEKLLNVNSWETDISKLSSGIYLVSVLDQNNVKSTQRLVVMR